MRVLMCPPDHYDVVDVKNPHMEGHAGTVDRALAHAQWDALERAFLRAGADVAKIDPLPGCEDMVFCANQTFVGNGADGRRLCMLSRMAHESRRREVPAFERWFRVREYRIVSAAHPFEGSGDALWHPGRRVVWMGHGPRTSRDVHDQVAHEFGVEVVSLKLRDDRFYHLDTCLCPVDGQTALVYPGAFDKEGMAAIRAGFPRLLEVSESDAVDAFACNAAAFFGQTVVIDRRAEETIARLRELGYHVSPVDTGEFLKSGGSVFCLRQAIGFRP